jgi:hypothetical protein
VLSAEFYMMELVDRFVYRTAEEMAALNPAASESPG